MRKSIFLAVLYAATANLFWAANAIVGKLIVATMPPFSLSILRWLCVLCILIPLGLPQMLKQWYWYRRHWQRLSLLALLSVTFYNTLQYWALEYTEALTVGSMLALMPLAISIVSWLYGGRRLSLLEWALTLVAMVGALLVITKGDFGSLLQGEDGQWRGLVLMLAAITSWALYSVYLKRLPNDGVHPLGLLTFSVLIGTLCLLPFWLLDIARGSATLPPKSLWWAIGFLAIFPSIVAYLCWGQAIRLADATLAGLMVTTAPLFNALLSLMFLDTKIVLTQWFGIAIVIFGVAATLLLGKRAG